MVVIPDRDAGMQTVLENNGGIGSTFIGVTGGREGGPYRMYSLFRFNVNPLPVNSTVIEATLQLLIKPFGNGNTSLPPGPIIGRLLRDWEEGNGIIFRPFQQTFQDSGVVYQTGWGTMGDTSFTEADYTNARPVSIETPPSQADYVLDTSSQLLSDVITWQTMPDSNFGIVVYDPCDSADENNCQFTLTALHTREQSLEEFRPTLTAIYDCPVSPLISGNILSGSYCGITSISTDGAIQNGENVIFLLDQEIEMQENFTIQLGGQFEVKVE